MNHEESSSSPGLTGQEKDLSQPEAEDRWGDLRLEFVGFQDRFEAITDGEVLYARVEGAEGVLGYLWASKDGEAAGFLIRDQAGIRETEAKRLWLRNLVQAKKTGLDSLTALGAGLGTTEETSFGAVTVANTVDLADGLAVLEERLRAESLAVDDEHDEEEPSGSD